jgi:hypothetical protein
MRRRTPQFPGKESRNGPEKGAGPDRGLKPAAETGAARFARRLAVQRTER